jgi:hypothetical protein
VDIHEKIKPVALALFSFPCSASGGERNFKVRSRIHTKTRNSLQRDKIDLQTSIAYNSKLLNRNIMKEGTRPYTLEELLIGCKVQENDVDALLEGEIDEMEIVEENYVE